MFSLLRSTTLTHNGARTGVRQLYAAGSSLGQIEQRGPGSFTPKSILEDDDTPVDLSEDNDAANGARPGTPPVHRRAPSFQSTPREFLRHKQVLAQTFPDGWQPPRKLSRDAMDGLRLMHQHDPQLFTTPVLASKFRISPEAVRRILKSKWEPSREKKRQLVARNLAARDEFLKMGRLQEKAAASKLLYIPKDGRGHARPYGKEWMTERQGEQARPRQQRKSSNRPLLGVSVRDILTL